MAEITPDFESIYTKEYWGDIPPMMNYKHDGTFSRVRESTQRNNLHHGRIGDYELEERMGEAIGKGMLQLYAGEVPEAIVQGELIGSKDDTKYALPGNILLLDTEEIWLRKPTYKGLHNAFRNEFELGASAVQLFKSKIRRETEYESQWRGGVSGLPRNLAACMGMTTEILTYERKVPLVRSSEYVGNHAREAVGTYTRSVSLVTFFVDKQGNVGSRKAYNSGVWESGNGFANFVTADPHMSGRIGETLNQTVNPDVTNLSRTRSAYICARGAFEHATVPAKARYHIFLGKFATSRA